MKDGEILSEKSVVENYKKVSFVAEKPLESKGWLLDVMFCIENLYCGVGFPNPTPNAIKSQINKRNIIVYFILLLFLLAFCVGFGDTTLHHQRRPNTTPNEPQHHKKFRAPTQ